MATNRNEMILTFAKEHGIKDFDKNPLFKHRTEISAISKQRNVDIDVAMSILRNDHPDYGIQPGHIDQFKAVARLYVADPNLTIADLVRP